MKYLLLVSVLLSISNADMCKYYAEESAKDLKGLILSIEDGDKEGASYSYHKYVINSKGAVVECKGEQGEKAKALREKVLKSLKASFGR